MCRQIRYYLLLECCGRGSCGGRTAVTGQLRLQTKPFNALPGIGWLLHAGEPVFSVVEAVTPQVSASVFPAFLDRISCVLKTLSIS